MEKINLEKLVGGSLQEKFTHSFRNVVENLQDPNTPYKNVREITIKLKFAQNEKRDDVKCEILVSEKLARRPPWKPRSLLAPTSVPESITPRSTASS